MKLCKTYVVHYLILTLFLAGGLMLTGCAPLSAEPAPPEALSPTESESATSVQTPGQALDAPLNAWGYELVTQVYEETDRRIKIAYPQITGLKGELLQDYMNQSLKKPVEALTVGASYTDVDVDYKVTLKNQERISVIMIGTGKLEGGREFNYLNSVNLDLKTSNEITFENFIKDDPDAKADFSEVLNQSAKDVGLPEVTEYEGMRLFFRPNEVVFYYMPLDDSAESFVQISVPLAELSGLINNDFGERPAS